MQCSRCGKKGFFLKLNSKGHCKDCEAVIREEEAKRLKEETRKHREELEKRFAQKETSKTPKEAVRQTAITFCFVSDVKSYLDNLKKLSYPNLDFEMTKSELIDSCLVIDKVWENNYLVNSIAFVSEPDNLQEPNAIRVEIEGLIVGYVPRHQCEHIVDIVEGKRIKSVECKISGGKYKCVDVDYSDSGREIYTLERGEEDYRIEIRIESYAN